MSSSLSHTLFFLLSLSLFSFLSGTGLGIVSHWSVKCPAGDYKILNPSPTLALHSLPSNLTLSNTHSLFFFSLSQSCTFTRTAHRSHPFEQRTTRTYFIKKTNCTFLKPDLRSCRPFPDSLHPETRVLFMCLVTHEVNAATTNKFSFFLAVVSHTNGTRRYCQHGYDGVEQEKSFKRKVLLSIISSCKNKKSKSSFSYSFSS